MTFIYPQFNWGFTHAFSADNLKSVPRIKVRYAFFVKFYQKQEKRLAPATVMIPATQMERELMAPSTGPISIARAVPMPWAAVPMASQRISFIFGIKPYISKQIDRKNYNKM